MTEPQPSLGAPVAPDDDATAAVDHPRPRLRRPTWLSLDGPWDFRLGDGDEPAAADRRDGRPRDYPSRIVVPFAPECPASGIGDPGFHPVVWYRRPIEVPADWTGRRVLLHLCGLEGVVDVWLGGRRLARLEGALTPVEVELGVADAMTGVRGGELLELRLARDPLDLGTPRGKQDWLSEPHSIWYPRSSGITRPVWLEAVPRQRLWSLDATSDLAAFALDLRVRLDGVQHGTPAAAGWRLALRFSVDGDLLAEERWTVTGPEVRRRVALPDPGIDDARDRLLWRPERPTLIDVAATLEHHGQPVDVVRSYTALRTVGVDADAFLLNGRPYPLRLVLDQGYWPETHRTAPDGDALRRDVELTKALGFNGVRKHQTIEDPRYLAWADRLGLLVWSELPSAYAYSATALRRLSTTWAAMIERDVGHPCVVAWVAFNESWGVPDLPDRADQRHAVRALYHLAKALDPSRPVIGNDGWEAVVGDLLTVHDYAADPAVLDARYRTREALAATLERLRPGGRAVRLDAGLEAVAPRAHRPVVLSEFGGVRAERGGDGWGYAQVDGGDALLARYAALLAAVSHGVLAGFCYTQLTDTFQEQNGLLTMDRRPKAALAALARATRGEGDA